MVAAEGEGSGAGRASPEKEMLSNDDRSWNVYENKQKCAKFTAKQRDISTQRNDILYRCTCVLLRPSDFLSLSKRWGTNLSLQNIETRGTGVMPGCSHGQDGDARVQSWPGWPCHI